MLRCECGRDYPTGDEFGGHCPVCEVDRLKTYVKDIQYESGAVMRALVRVTELIVGGDRGSSDSIRYRLARTLVEVESGREKWDLMPLFEQAIRDIKERDSDPDRPGPGQFEQTIREIRERDLRQRAEADRGTEIRNPGGDS